MSVPESGKRGGVCPAGQDARVCADCGAIDDLYFHERDGEWACEEVADCIERQREQERAESERLRGLIADLCDPKPGCWQAALKAGRAEVTDA